MTWKINKKWITRELGNRERKDMWFHVRCVLSVCGKRILARGGENRKKIWRRRLNGWNCNQIKIFRIRRWRYSASPSTVPQVDRGKTDARNATRSTAYVSKMQYYLIPNVIIACRVVINNPPPLLIYDNMFTHCLNNVKLFMIT